MQSTVSRIASKMAQAPPSPVALLSSAASGMVNTPDRFGFTRAFIFPYDGLDFCRSGVWALA
jgi:hypothetical protein